jgi:AcrR family transcriptional regulator
VSPPKQVRSQRTLERLIDAAEGLIEERGLEGLSIPEVVRRAQSSTGSFYARFRDKNALLRAVEERFFGRLNELVGDLFDEARWRETPTAEIVAVCVEEMLRNIDRHAQLVRAFVFRSAGEPGFEAEIQGFRDSVVIGFRRLLLDRRDEMRHPDPEFAIDLGLESAFAFMQGRILTGGRPMLSSRRVDDETLKRELTRLFLGYIGIDPPGPTPGVAATPIQLNERTTS